MPNGLGDTFMLMASSGPGVYWWALIMGPLWLHLSLLGHNQSAGGLHRLPTDSSWRAGGSLSPPHSQPLLQGGACFGHLHPGPIDDGRSPDLRQSGKPSHCGADSEESACSRGRSHLEKAAAARWRAAAGRVQWEAARGRGVSGSGDQ